MLPVIEQFVSIDGEGPTAGEMAAFVRFLGCNLRCSWCDTAYSWDASVAPTWRTATEIYQWIFASGCRNVTLTGGEPLIQEEIMELLQLLGQEAALAVHVETNGAVDLAPFKERCPYGNIHYVVDYKLPDSGMEERMLHDNFTQVTANDVYKFVIASDRDLQRAVELTKRHQLAERCLVYFSPVRERIAPHSIVEAMRQHMLNGVRLQLQLHKLIWPEEMRGV